MLMQDATPPKPTYLTDYRPSPYTIDRVDLTFELHPTKTGVTAKLLVAKNPKSNETGPLILNGEEMKLISVAVDGKELKEGEYTVDDKTLSIDRVPQQSFELVIKNQIDPKNNTALDGLYMSGDFFCSQNEPQGFRRITYFLDRSDVMAKYTTKIIADKEKFPILLSNGNKIESGDLDDGKHFAVWEDPFNKPSYLFALVAGDLGKIEDQYTTKSGRTVDLVIYSEHGNEKRCRHAMESLKRSMKWDEDVFGLEYDLDIFMIVAVDAFNMGAMENKGLNIFNTSCILASPESETDANFERVEGVVGHEYFHNWTGNRVTCRDWFQLTLKEGLTVFRDQEFSSDMNSRPVKRIEEVEILRKSQFVEDSGPTAHPIKPKSYLQINNFYTSTVYCKGAEVIRMIYTLIGKENFRKGIDKYFELFDGQAATTEDFVHAMHLASGFDFSQFTRWYDQAGTPSVEVSLKRDEENNTTLLKVKQHTASTADDSPKEPFHFPLVAEFFDEEGNRVDLGDQRRIDEGYLFEVKEREQVFTLPIDQKVIASVNRDFRVPANVHLDCSLEELAFLMQYDTDPFNRFESCMELSMQLMQQFVKEKESSKWQLPEYYLNAYRALIDDTTLDLSIKALCLSLPTEDRMGSWKNHQNPILIDENHKVNTWFHKEIASHFEDEFKALYDKSHDNRLYHFNPTDVGMRSIKNCALSYLCKTEKGEYFDLANEQYQNGTNMTDQLAAMTILSNHVNKYRENVLDHYQKRWAKDPLAMTKWFGVQANSPLPDALRRIMGLREHPSYDESIPNFIRALICQFTENHIHFHDLSGEGYEYIADAIISIDSKNPQAAARIAKGFKNIGKLDMKRKALVCNELNRIMKKSDLSSNVREIVSKGLAIISADSNE